MKILKAFFWLIGVLVVLAVTAAIALPLLFDPNDLRVRIGDEVKAATGRTLTISGDLRLNVFPWLAVHVGETRLGNAEGFGDEAFAEFKSVDVGVRLMPLLFERALEVRTVSIEGLRLRLAKNKDGRDNWSDLAKPRTAQASAPDTEAHETKSEGLSSLSVSGLNLREAELSFDDRSSSAVHRLQDFSLETGALAPGKPAQLKAAGRASSSKAGVTADFKLAATLDADTARKTYGIEGLVLEVIAQGKTLPGGKQTLTLSGGLRYDQAAGSFKTGDLLLALAGLRLKSDLEGSGLNGEAPKLKGRLAAERFSPRALATALGVSLPDSADASVLGEASFSADYEGDFKSARLNKLSLRLDQTSASGTLSVQNFAAPSIQFALKADALDADRYLPKPAEKAAASGGGKSGGGAIEDKLPLDALDALNAAGTLDIGKFKLRNLTFTDVTLRLNAPKGAAKTQELSAKFYGGSINQSLRLTPGARPGYVINANLAGVNAGPAVRDFMDKDVIEGTARVTAALTSGGDRVSDIKRALNGDITFRFENGAVKGFNLAEVIRGSQALFQGQAYAKPAQAAQTDFAEISGSAKAVNGVLRSDDLTAKSPLFRLAGAGTVDLVAERIDYLAKPTVINSLSGQGGKDLSDVRGLTIPIQVFGALSAPQWKIDWGPILQAKVVDKLNQQIEKKLGESGGDLGKALQNLFQKKK